MSIHALLMEYPSARQASQYLIFLWLCNNNTSAVTANTLFTCISSEGFAPLQELLEHNILLNGAAIGAAGGLATAFPLVWGETDCSKLDEEWLTPDAVVAADVIYQRELMVPLLETMKALGDAFLSSQDSCLLH